MKHNNTKSNSKLQIDCGQKTGWENIQAHTLKKTEIKSKRRENYEC